MRSSNDPGVTVTEWDGAFLKSLYETRRTVTAGLQRSNMTRIVREELEAGEPGSKQAN